MEDKEIKDYVNNTITVYKAESIQEYRKWSNELPFLEFPSDWLVKIVPPHGGAIIRFAVQRKGEEKTVSVYLDCYDRLGSVGRPYWELYPYNYNGKEDTFRCFLEETEELLGAIDKALGNKKVILTKI